MRGYIPRWHIEVGLDHGCGFLLTLLKYVHDRLVFADSRKPNFFLLFDTMALVIFHMCREHADLVRDLRNIHRRHVLTDDS